ncbi:hypothetical protein Tsubulata_034931 [Turnera subulata]|uniref:RRM domain-containing protein n=1 Tax=Turnera subulata TaxID=218843 RepID=A0A9Q0JEB3_9ROSI|nr:hypothetical protein Tsubulata_034931 [Turnera subulata]
MAHPPPTRPMKAESEDGEAPSNNLWVGNLTQDVSDADLMELFDKYGAMDSVITYCNRSYAFVFLKHVEDAKAARDALQGTPLRGNPIKIEFARPAKPSKNLWVGGISPAVTKEELEQEFQKFGKLEDFRFAMDRNTALIEYSRLEDASQAMKNMNGKRIGGEQIRVDFLRSHPVRREPDFRESRDSPFSSTHAGARRTLPTQPSGGRKDGPPSNILWVGYPPSVQIDEQLLHNAMILFGEIERIKSFPARNYSFVEFRSVDEARRAKEGLQGRLFNDPRITIMYSSSGMAPGKDGFYPGIKGPRGEMFNENPFGPLEMVDHPRGTGISNYGAPLHQGSLHRPVRPFGPQAGFGHGLPGTGTEYNDLAFQDGVHAHGPGGRPQLRPGASGWDVLDPNQFERESKRARIDDHGLGLEKVYGPGADGVLGTHRKSLSPVGARAGGGPIKVHSDGDYVWRGIIAKGGTPVCRARCVPIGKGIESEMPEVINCSARTGLDMLAKHYAEAVGFDIVFFLPDSFDDFPSYTEFLRYLGSKNRAGVAKFDDGTTLFLVPPSDFLSKVLKVTGPERLYGVVLKLPQAALGSASMQPQLHQPTNYPQYADGRYPPHEAEYGLVQSNEERDVPRDYTRVLQEDSKLNPRSYYPVTTAPSAPVDYATTNNAAVSQTGVLTPELIATLASILPATAQPSTSETAQLGLSSSAVTPSFSSVALDKGTSSQGWKHDNQVSGHLNHLAPGNQFNSQLPVQSQFQSYPSVSHSANVAPGGIHNQDAAVNLPHQGPTASRPLGSFVMPSQSAQFALNPQVQSANYSQTQSGMPLAGDKVNWELPSQVQQFQTAVSGPGHQPSSEVEADKNQRYQSTLQFAANLLLQIQQRQQQTGNPAVRGSGNQQ